MNSGNRSGRVFRSLLAIILIGVIAYSGYEILNINQDYTQEAKMHERVLEFKPAEPKIDMSALNEEGPINTNILALQELNDDIVGWITVNNTNVDYPFVLASDNDLYLHRDLEKKQAQAGSIFMDYRCSKDFSDFNTILYGHHMKNGSMFGSLKRFVNKDFFEANKTATIFLSHKIYTLEIFAYVVLKPNDQIIYSVSQSAGYLKYIKSVARQYRDISLHENDRIVTLSSCNYEFNNARMVLLAKVSE